MDDATANSDRLASLLEKALAEAAGRKSRLPSAARESQGSLAPPLSEEEEAAERRYRFQALAEKVRERLKELRTAPPRATGSADGVSSPPLPASAQSSKTAAALPPPVQQVSAVGLDPSAGGVRRMENLQSETTGALLQELEVSLNEQRGAIRKLESKLSEAREQAATLQQRQEEAERRRIASEELLERAEQEAAHWRDRCRQLEQELRTWEQRCPSPRDESVNGVAAPSVSECTLREEKERLLEELAQARMEIAGMAAREAEDPGASGVDELRSSLQSYRDRISDLESQVAQERITVAQVEEECRKVRDINDALGRVLETKEAELQDKSAMIAECTDAMRRHQIKLLDVVPAFKASSESAIPGGAGSATALGEPDTENSSRTTEALPPPQTEAESLRSAILSLTSAASSPAQADTSNTAAGVERAEAQKPLQRAELRELLREMEKLPERLNQMLAPSGAALQQTNAPSEGGLSQETSEQPAQTLLDALSLDAEAPPDESTARIAIGKRKLWVLSGILIFIALGAFLAGLYTAIR